MTTTTYSPPLAFGLTRFVPRRRKLQANATAESVELVGSSEFVIVRRDERLEELRFWTAASESVFDFWDNELDAEYDNL